MSHEQDQKPDQATMPLEAAPADMVATPLKSSVLTDTKRASKIATELVSWYEANPNHLDIINDTLRPYGIDSSKSKEEIVQIVIDDQKKTPTMLQEYDAAAKVQAASLNQRAKICADVLQKAYNVHPSFEKRLDVCADILQDLRKAAPNFEGRVDKAIESVVDLLFEMNHAYNVRIDESLKPFGISSTQSREGVRKEIQGRCAAYDPSSDVVASFLNDITNALPGDIKKEWNTEDNDHYTPLHYYKKNYYPDLQQHKGKSIFELLEIRSIESKDDLKAAIRRKCEDQSIDAIDSVGGLIKKIAEGLPNYYSTEGFTPQYKLLSSYNGKVPVGDKVPSLFYTEPTKSIIDSLQQKTSSLNGSEKNKPFVDGIESILADITRNFPPEVLARYNPLEEYKTLSQDGIVHKSEPEIRMIVSVKEQAAQGFPSDVIPILRKEAVLCSEKHPELKLFNKAAKKVDVRDLEERVIKCAESLQEWCDNSVNPGETLEVLKRFNLDLKDPGVIKVIRDQSLSEKYSSVEEPDKIKCLLEDIVKSAPEGSVRWSNPLTIYEDHAVHKFDESQYIDVKKEDVEARKSLLSKYEQEDRKGGGYLRSISREVSNPSTTESRLREIAQQVVGGDLIDESTDKQNVARAAELADRKAAREAIDKTAIKKMNREGLLGIINEFSVLHNVPHSDESGLPLNQPHVSGKATERGTPSLDGTPFTHSKQKKSDRSW